MAFNINTRGTRSVVAVVQSVEVTTSDCVVSQNSKVGWAPDNLSIQITSVAGLVQQNTARGIDEMSPYSNGEQKRTNVENTAPCGRPFCSVQATDTPFSAVLSNWLLFLFLIVFLREYKPADRVSTYRHSSRSAQCSKEITTRQDETALIFS